MLSFAVRSVEPLLVRTSATKDADVLAVELDVEIVQRIANHALTGRRAKRAVDRAHVAVAAADLLARSIQEPAPALAVRRLETGAVLGDESLEDALDVRADRVDVGVARGRLGARNGQDGTGGNQGGQDGDLHERVSFVIS